MSKDLRRLRPASSRATSSQTIAPFTFDSSKPRAKVACNECRQRKTACDSGIPRCRACIRRGTQCTNISVEPGETPAMALKREHANLQASQEAADSLIQYFNGLPDAQALSILRRWQRQSDAKELMQSLLTQSQDAPSTRQAAQAVAGSTSSQNPLDLRVGFPTTRDAPSLSNMSSEVIGDFLPPAGIRSSRSGYETLKSPVNVPSSVFDDGYPLDHHISGDLGNNSNIEHSTSTSDQSTVLIGPPRPPTLYDVRLRRLQISHWSDVPVSNEFAALVISSWLAMDHPIHALFDKDIFLDELVAGSENLCSRLLVSSLLFASCQTYVKNHPYSATFVAAFYDEAEKNMAVQQSVDSVSTMVAATLLGVGCTYQARDSLSSHYVSLAIGMGKRLKLFGVEHDVENYEDFETLSDDMLVVTAQSAWAVYNWTRLVSMHYHNSGANIAPMLPIPGDDYNDFDDFLARRINAKRPPSEVNSTFVALAKFWPIFQKMSLLYYATSTPTIDMRIPFADVEVIYNELLNWKSNLPVSYRNITRVPHHVAYTHVLYHTTILDLFRPFRSLLRPQALQPFHHMNSSPRKVFAASIQELEGIVTRWGAQYEFAPDTLLMHTATLYLANTILQGENEGSHQLQTLDLCFLAYVKLSAGLRFAEVILKGLLVMAMHKGMKTSEQCNEILFSIQRYDKLYQISAAVEAYWVTDHELASKNRSAALAGTLAERFNDSVFDELTTIE